MCTGVVQGHRFTSVGVEQGSRSSTGYRELVGLQLYNGYNISTVSQGYRCSNEV
jgi:hypothetical protein